jgi:hypothetical protein
MVSHVGSITTGSVPNLRQDGQKPAGDALKAALAKTQSNPKNGIFGSNGAGVPAKQQDLLRSISTSIDSDRWSYDRNGIPERSFLSTRTTLLIQMYLAGNADNRDQSPSQRLANMMSVLGPERTYAMLVSTPVYVTKTSNALDFQSWLNTLIKNGQFTADDAKALGLGQAEFARLDPHNFRRIVSAVGFMISAPNDRNGAAVRDGYVQGIVTGAQRLAQEIGSDKYPEHVQIDYMTNLNRMFQEATNLSFSDPTKKQLFSQLRAAATQLAGKGDGKLGGVLKLSDVLNAHAANILGLLGDKSQIAKTLRAMGGVGRNGAIDPNSDLAKFLQSALSGQSQFGMASANRYMMTWNGRMPQGVTHLLNGIADSGDTKLIAGTLDTAMQWTIRNPTQAEVLASQDTQELHTRPTGYRNALTNLLDKSFNQFVALNPSDRNATIVRTMQPQTIADLQALSAVVMGPPYDSGIAGHFAEVFGKHAVQFAAMAVDPAKHPELDRLLAGGGDRRSSAAVIFGQLMNGFAAGLNHSEEGFLAQARDTKAAADLTVLRWRVLTDLLRGFGTGLLLASAWFPGGQAAAFLRIPGGANTEKVMSVIGRTGLFSGSLGTVVLDAFFSDTGERNKAQAQARAVEYVGQQIQAAGGETLLLQQIYDGWFSKISQLRDPEGQAITYGVMIGSSFADAEMVQGSVKGFYGAYNPVGYYFSQTGQYPSLR